MNTIPQFCQNCREKNALGEPTCKKCGTRLMLVVFPQSLKYDTNHVPTYYEDHLLERVTLLELRLSQITERLAMTLDLMLRQTKTSHTDHLLLETLIESLNTLGAIEKETLTQNWRERVDSEQIKETAESRREKVLTEILARDESSNPELFEHLVKEGIRLLSANEEKQSFRMLERALLLSPKNFPLLMLVAENYFRTDKFEPAKNYLEKAQKLLPNNPKVRLLLGVIYADEGDAPQAEKLLKPLAAKKEKAFCVNYILGMLAALKEDWATALAAFKTTAASRELPEINYLIACVYFERDRYKIALRYLRKAVEADTNFADAWFMSSVIYKYLSDGKKAEETRELALQSRETGAQCLEFLKRRAPENLTTALPFLRLRHLKNRLLTGGSIRLTKLFREELFKNLN
ncbi:MAG: tetratricopeptide repeat protein [Pyrinomonadaceae bacterium]